MEWVVGIMGAANACIVWWAVREIRALRRTAAAQDQTIQAVGHVNRTVLEVFKTLRPERFLEHIEVYEALIEKKAEALVEDERRRVRQERENSTRSAVEITNRLMDRLEAYVKAAVTLTVYVPKNQRRSVIEGMSLPDGIKKILVEAGEKLPDPADLVAHHHSAPAPLPPPPPPQKEPGK